MRIVFMGTPEFAVASLEALCDHPDVEVLAVVTATDKLGGRGGKTLLESDVKRFAVERKLPVLQPPNLKSPKFQAKLSALQADLFVVVAFRMLPEAVWSMPPLGTINVHGSLLPAYRGAAPIHWAVINGENRTGVSIFFLQHEIDTGPILHQAEIAINENESTSEVYERLKKLGAEALVEAIDKIAEVQTEGKPQDESLASPAPKIFHDDARIDWNKSAREVHNFIRGMSSFPGAWTLLEDQELKVYKAILRPDLSQGHLAAGSLCPILSAGNEERKQGGLGVLCGDGHWIELLELKPAGKRKMSGVDFRNGLRIQDPILLT